MQRLRLAAQFIAFMMLAISAIDTVKTAKVGKKVALFIANMKVIAPCCVTVTLCA